MVIESVLKMNDEYLDELARIRKMTENGVELVLFGCGSTSEFIVDKFVEEYCIRPYCFVDNDVHKKEEWGGMVRDIQIINYSDLIKIKGNTYIYITTQMYYSEIYDQLVRDGFDTDMISQYDVIPQFEWEKEYKGFICDNLDEIKKLYRELADDASREVLYNRLAFLVTRRREYAIRARNIGNRLQYFDDTVIDINSISTVIDLGAYVGDSAFEYIKLRGDKGFKAIYEFEPDEDYYKMAQQTLKEYSNVVYIKKGTSDKNEIMQVKSNLGSMNSIESKLFLETKDEITTNVGGVKTYDICVLDEEMAGREEKIDFIKMDIEGAEYNTLIGSRDIIQKDKPILAICVYHKEDDIVKIPSLLRKYNNQYRFYIRHYSDNQTETVLYATERKN